MTEVAAIAERGDVILDRSRVPDAPPILRLRWRPHRHLVFNARREAVAQSVRVSGNNRAASALGCGGVFIAKARGHTLGYHVSSLGMLMLAGMAPLVPTTVFMAVAAVPDYMRGGPAALGMSSDAQVLASAAAVVGMGVAFAAFSLAGACRIRVDGDWLRVEGIFRRSALRRANLRFELRAEDDTEVASATLHVSDDAVTVRVGDAWRYAKTAAFAEHLRARLSEFQTPALYRGPRPHAVSHDASPLAEGMRAGDAYLAGGDQVLASSSRRGRDAGARPQALAGAARSDHQARRGGRRACAHAA